MIEEPVVDAVQRDWMRSYNSSGVAQLMVDVLLPDRRKVQYDTVKHQALVVSLPCLDQALIRARGRYLPFEAVVRFAPIYPLRTP